MSFVPFDAAQTRIGGPALIEASAGTGKTYAIGSLFLRLLLEKELRVPEILVVTFTEAATKELRERIRGRLSAALDVAEGAAEADPFLSTVLSRVEPERVKPLLRTAVASIDEASIFTIHGFCRRVLSDHAFECGMPFEIEFTKDQRELISNIVDDFWRTRIMSLPEDHLAYLHASGFSRRTLSDFLKPAYLNPLLTVVPDLQPEGLDPVLSACRASYGHVREAWDLSRDAVAGLIREGGLNARSYSAAKIAAITEAMDRYTRLDSPFDLLEELEFFCPAKLASCTNKGKKTPEHPFFLLCEALQEARQCLDEAGELFHIRLEGELIRYVRDELGRRKRELNTLSFDDLIHVVREALEGESADALAAAVRERYRAALIDEFQDTDPAQYTIFSRLFGDGEGALFLIGDPKQAIYSFRGADIFAYLRASRDTSRRETLRLNWRSSQRLLDGINTLFCRPAAFLFEGIEATRVAAAQPQVQDRLRVDDVADDAPLRITYVPREGEKPLSRADGTALVARSVATSISRLLAGDGERVTVRDRQVAPGDISVLVRANDEGRLVRDELRRLLIPAVMYGTENLFESAEVEELQRILRAVAEPWNDRLLKGALATEILGFRASDLAALQEDEAGWNDIVARFSGYNDLWLRDGFMAMARRLLKQEGVRTRLLPYQDGERRLTNILHAIELLHRVSVEQHPGPEALVKWLAEQRVAREAKDEYELRLESDDDAVKIVTIHRSKGLEYPIVFVPFCWGRVREEKGAVIFHDPQSGDAVLDLGSGEVDTGRSLAAAEALAEDLRLLYVALTRAMYRCHLVWGSFSGSGESALGWLLHGRDGDTPAAVSARLKGMTEEAAMADLQRLTEASGGALAVQPLVQGEGLPWQGNASGRVPCECLPFTRQLERDWRLASYSGFVSGAAEEAALPGRDEAAGTEEGSPADERGAGFTIADFPRGSAPGSCLHDVLEMTDFTAPPQSEAVAATLARWGYGAEWGHAVEEMVATVAHTRMYGEYSEVVLREVPRHDTVREMEFHLPLAPVRGEDLRRLLLRHDPPAEVRDMLARLDFGTVRGFLKGYIDMVFRHDGRFYLIDWKSNYLGRTVADYRPPRLASVMAHEFYWLQYHLYVAALHRYLRGRLPGYRYDSHFGGVFYLFLRGLSADGSTGVHAARPAADLVEDLAAFIAEGGSHA